MAHYVIIHEAAHEVGWLGPFSSKAAAEKQKRELAATLGHGYAAKVATRAKKNPATPVRANPPYVQHPVTGEKIPVASKADARMLAHQLVIKHGVEVKAYIGNDKYEYHKPPKWKSLPPLPPKTKKSAGKKTASGLLAAVNSAKKALASGDPTALKYAGIDLEVEIAKASLKKPTALLAEANKLEAAVLKMEKAQKTAKKNPTRLQRAGARVRGVVDAAVVGIDESTGGHAGSRAMIAAQRKAEELAAQGRYEEAADVLARAVGRSVSAGAVKAARIGAALATRGGSELAVRGNRGGRKGR